MVLISMALQLENYTVKTVPNVDNIVAIARAFKPDIVLVDLWMPGIGGEGAVRALQADEATCDKPMMLLSASSEVADAAKRLGIPYLEKPFEIKELRSRVADLLSGKP